jgi:galactofuranosylgalactofuranosylrhamnosyl-N-acetylglucosaminyl-diphospho-decaprenol beta-1,5/1,6-galactofuranosyltransferase
LHLRSDADFGGWWMNLIPVEALEKLGLSMPVFIKFDDLEYGMRARDAGYQTVCPAGVGLWHMAWHDKEPHRTWEEYFNIRNRILTALMQMKRNDKGQSLPKSVRTILVGNAFKYHYSMIPVYEKAFRDVLRGPEYICQTIGQVMPEARKLRQEYTDGNIKPHISDFPPIENIEQRQKIERNMKTRPNNSLKTAYLAASALIRNLFTSPSDEAERSPQYVLPGKDARWYRLINLDSLLITSSDGSGVAWFRRSRKNFIKMLSLAVLLPIKLKRNFKKLHTQYRDSDWCSVATWEKIFADNPAAEIPTTAPASKSSTKKVAKAPAKAKKATKKTTATNKTASKRAK